METCQCSVRHPRYKKTACLRAVTTHRGIPHLGLGPRGFWVEWSDEQTKKIDFWMMIQKLTDRAKLRHRQEDNIRREQTLKKTRSGEVRQGGRGGTGQRWRDHVGASQERYDYYRWTQEENTHRTPEAS